MTADNDSVRADTPTNECFDSYCDWLKNDPAPTISGAFKHAWQASRERYVPSGAVEFARHMFTQVWPEGGIDGGELQGLGERFGLLKPVEVTEPCGEGCNCDYFSGDFPMTCYKLNLSDTPNGGN